MTKTIFMWNCYKVYSFKWNCVPRWSLACHRALWCGSVFICHFRRITYGTCLSFQQETNSFQFVTNSADKTMMMMPMNELDRIKQLIQLKIWDPSLHLCNSQFNQNKTNKRQKAKGIKTMPWRRNDAFERVRWWFWTYGITRHMARSVWEDMWCQISKSLTLDHKEWTQSHPATARVVYGFCAWRNANQKNEIEKGLTTMLVAFSSYENPWQIQKNSGIDTKLKNWEE